ncbi:replication protein A 70 kDa DNA-binding subunit C-like [Cryptomeria japonica]|uniref:replication protein A 70 kDa DNA-binding subunit C-like n=1 Tax=Cryptomeria japonica TaxID=3369 RepID=UPI0027DAB295|nr:replication protein A 70 kDa DNA-binding subunit C-like [Cryptomeria japonica]
MQHESSVNISPIKALNPYQNKTIKGRVTNKRKMHQYSTPKSTSQVFSFDMIDDEGTEISITCFGDVAEMHYHRVEARTYYTVSKGCIKEADTKWNKLNSHLEITLDNNSVLKCCEAVVDSQGNNSPFTPINEITYYTNNTLVDVIGIVVVVGEPSLIRRKDGSEVTKRIVKINDVSTFTINVKSWATTWQAVGEDLKNMHATQTTVVLAVRNARVGYFNGKMKLQDHTDTLWATGFDEVGTNLLQISAKDLYMLQYDLTTKRTPQTIIKRVLLSCFVFTLSVTTNMYNSEPRLKATITKVTNINFQAECTLLLAEIARTSIAAAFQTN